MGRTASLERQWEAVTDTGESLVFERCKGGYFSTLDEHGLKVRGKTEQKLLTGKNLSEVSTAEVSTAQNNYNYARLYFRASLNESCTITAGVEITAGAFNKITVLDYPNGQRQTVDVIDGKITCTFTKTSDAVDSVLLYAGVIGSTAGNGCIFSNIQIEKGTTATPYEEYSGGKPAPNTDYPQAIRCVKAGTKIICGEGEITLPCDLYEGDIYYPASGKVERWSDAFTLGTGITLLRNEDATSAKHLYYFIRPHERKEGSCSHFFPHPYGAVDNSFSAEGNARSVYLNLTGHVAEYTPEAARAWQTSVGKDVNVVIYRTEAILEQYEPQPLAMTRGSAIVTQQPEDLPATLTATILSRR